MHGLRALHASCRGARTPDVLPSLPGQEMTYRLLALVLFATSGIHAAEPALLYKPGEAARVMRYLRYPSLPRLTDAKIDMAPSVATLCGVYPPLPSNPAMLHLKPGIHLYANAQAIAKAGE